MNVADRIKQLRARAGISVDTLADRAGVDRMTVHRLERGRVPQVDTLGKICKALDISLAQFFDESDFNPNEFAGENSGFTELNRVLEIFGRSVELPFPTGDSHWEAIKNENPNNPYKDMPCPFAINSNCDKIRKARPNPLIGNCTFGINRRARGFSSRNYEPWIVCPKRFAEDNKIFQESLYLFDDSTLDKKIIKELEIGEAGRIDYGFYTVKDGLIEEFIGIEIQSMGTTNSGGFWEARNEYLNTGHVSPHDGGLNIKDASKKILIQMLHKGAQMSRWGHKYVLIIQDLFLNHLEESYNISSHLHDFKKQDPIHIHAYSLSFDPITKKVHINITRKNSIDILGLSMAIISNPLSEYLEFSDLTRRILNRQNSGNVTDY